MLSLLCSCGNAILCHYFPIVCFVYLVCIALVGRVLPEAFYPNFTIALKLPLHFTLRVESSRQTDTVSKQFSVQLLCLLPNQAVLELKCWKIKDKWWLPRICKSEFLWETCLFLWVSCRRFYRSLRPLPAALLSKQLSFFASF